MPDFFDVICLNCGFVFESDHKHNTCDICGCEFDEYNIFDITVECDVCLNEYSEMFDEVCPYCEE